MSNLIVPPGGREPSGARPLTTEVGAEWGIVGAVGLVFAVVGFADLVLAVAPIQFGSAEWEFGTVTSVMNNLPLFTVAVCFVALSAFARGSASLVRFVGIMFGVAAAIVLIMAILWGKNLDEARRSVTEAVLKDGLERSITRTTVQLLAYGIGFGFLAWKALRVGRRSGTS